MERVTASTCSMRCAASLAILENRALSHPGHLQTHTLDFPNSFLAVDFFFCLSGFVIAPIPSTAPNEPNTSSFPRLLMVVRLTRLYPLFALGLAIGVVRGIFLAHLVSRIHWPAFLSLIGLAAALIPNFLVPCPLPALCSFL